MRDLSVVAPQYVGTLSIPVWLSAGSRDHWVYMAWDEADPEEVLYVGVTSHLFMRLAQHAQGARWWEEAAFVDVHRFQSRAEAEAAERSMIVRLDPRYNVVRP